MLAQPAHSSQRHNRISGVNLQEADPRSSRPVLA
jgi:hypothetical protein